MQLFADASVRCWRDVHNEKCRCNVHDGTGAKYSTTGVSYTAGAGAMHTTTSAGATNTVSADVIYPPQVQVKTMSTTEAKPQLL